MNEIMKFEDTEVEIIEINGEPHFEVYSTGKALGYARWNGGRTSCTPQRDRIDNTIKNAEIIPIVLNGQKFFSEAQLYDFMLEARTDKCKPFRKWITGTVLPNLRRTGTYTLPGAQPRVYPPKATSVGEVAQLLKVLRATMKDNDQPPEIIAQMVKTVCDQFGIVLPPNFVKVNPFQQFALVGMFWQGQGQLSGQ